MLSHPHGDGWDRIARRGLPRHVPIVTTPHAARRMQGLHRSAARWACAPGSTSTSSRTGALLRVTSLPGRHAPGPARYLLPPVMGSLLELMSAGDADDRRLRLYITATLYDGVREIARWHPRLDAAVVDLGGTRLPGVADGHDGRPCRSSRTARTRAGAYDVYQRLRWTTSSNGLRSGCSIGASALPAG